MRSGRSLALNVGGAIGLACIANAFVFLVNPAEKDSSIGPPGYIIGGVWVVLFAAMGVSRWLVKQRGGSGSILALILFCAAYPVYTLGLKSLTIGLAGNIATAAMSLWVVVKTFRVSRWAAGLIFSVAVWVSYASFLIYLQMRVHA